MKLVTFLSILLLFSCAKNHHPAPVKDVQHKRQVHSGHPLSKQHKFQPRFIHVDKGDTLYSIGFSHNVDYKTLARINNIRPPYRIYPGQKLKLQAGKNLQASNKVSKPVTHKPYVKKASTTTPTIKQYQPNSRKPLAVNVKNTKPIKKSQTAKVPATANTRWIWPAKGKLSSTFSATDTSRKGIDISAKFASDVYASNHGTVVYSGDGLRGYGELIIIKHSNNLLSAYAHNSKRLVKEGSSVKQSDVIAQSGKGTDGRPLLHFEIRKNGQPVNPLKYLPKK